MNPGTDAEREALSREGRALEAALVRFATRRDWLAAPEGAALESRLLAHLGVVRRFAPPAAAPAHRDWLHVAHWNVLQGLYYEHVLEALQVEGALAGADLVSLNETDLGLARSGNRDVAFDLARQVGMHAAWTPLFLELGPGYRTPPAVAARGKREGLFGLALLSRFPLGEVRRVELATPSDLLFDRERRAGRFVALVAQVMDPAAPFTVIVAHLDVHGGPADRGLQMRQVLEAVPPGPAILAGDLNTTTFQRGGWLRAVRTLATLALASRPSLRARLLAPHLPAGAAREPLFDALRAHGFDFDSFSDGCESLDLRLADVHELDLFPEPLRAAVLALLRGVERRNVFRLDWIAARGFVPAPERPPFTLRHRMRGPHPASDHAPIGCGLRAASGSRPS